MFFELLRRREFIALRFLFLEKLQRIVNNSFLVIPEEIKLEITALYKAKTLGYSIKVNRDNYLLKKSNYDLLIRRSGSDILVFQQIVIDQEYDMLRQLSQHLNLQVEAILDCGANVGYSSIMFQQYFRNAKIIAIEPDPDNFAILSLNVKAYKNLTPINAGIWWERDRLAISNTYRDSKEWSRKLSKGIGYDDVEVDTISSFMSDQGLGQIDILKIDIEGSEFEIFERDKDINNVLENVRILAIEIHNDCGDPGIIIQILLNAGFSLVADKETVFAYRLNG